MFYCDGYKKFNVAIIATVAAQKSKFIFCARNVPRNCEFRPLGFNISRVF